MQQKEPAAAETRIPWLDHGQRGGDGDRRIKGITAAREDFMSGFSRQRMGAGNGRLWRAWFRGVCCQRQQYENQQETG
jgi:hypothetical protein